MKKLCTLMIVLLPWLVGAQTVKRYEILITEIMADPSPVVGLPNAEYLEIRNMSGSPVDLFGWKLSDAATTATINVHLILQPDSMLILCANSNVAGLSAHGRTLGIPGFPSLDNDGDLLVLKTNTHLTIHSVHYDPSWYTVTSKSEGGWSLEMIDTKQGCSGRKNWKGSISDKGGTPGKNNSVSAINADTEPPRLIRAISPDSLSMLLFFDETVDSVSTLSLSSYQVTGNVVVNALCTPPLYNTVLLRLSSPLKKEEVYSVTVTGLKDCKGNQMTDNTIKAGLPSPPVMNDVVINEILFDPPSGGYDYVEIFNNSNKVIDLFHLFLANRDGNGLVSSPVKLSAGSFYLFPDEHRVITEDSISLGMHYLVRSPENIIGVSQLPSYPDDKGQVLLLDLHGNVLDEVSYNKDWHFALISGTVGISLERIDPGKPPLKANWHSAASTAGYGTPGYKNSQYHASENFDAAINIFPKLISPDNDGKDDYLTIEYQLAEHGFVANLSVFEVSGRLIRSLVQNDLLALKGKWTWDGLDANRKKLVSGSYIIFIEIYDLKGMRKRWKEVVVVAS